MLAFHLLRKKETTGKDYIKTNIDLEKSKCRIFLYSSEKY